MRAVAKRRFKDKYTDEVYEAGSELEITPERYAEIRATDATLIVAVAEEPEQEAGEQGTADAETDEQEAGQQGTADAETDEQEAGEQGTADAETDEQEAGQQDTAETEPEQAAEAAGLTKPKRAKKQAKQDE